MVGGDEPDTGLSSKRGCHGARYAHGGVDGAVRTKAKDIVLLLSDDERLRDERKTAKKNQDRFIGVSSSGMGSEGGRYDDWESTRGSGEGKGSGGRKHFDEDDHGGSHRGGYRGPSDDEGGHQNDDDDDDEGYSRRYGCRMCT
jgi:hypothetical protein